MPEIGDYGDVLPAEMIEVWPVLAQDLRRYLHHEIIASPTASALDLPGRPKPTGGAAS